jgi:hypothetical protein
MKKHIDLMAQILQKNNLGNLISEGVKNKKEEDHVPKKGNHHVFVAINSPYDSWIIDSGASHLFLDSMLKTPYSQGGIYSSSSSRRGKSGNP